MIHSPANNPARKDLSEIGWKVHQGAEVYDGQWCLLCRDPATGDTIWFFEEDGKYHFRLQQDVENTMNYNRAMRDMTEGKRFGDYVLLGAVPDAIAVKAGLHDATAQRDNKYLAKFFNDGDNSAFRGSRGRV